MAEGDHQCVLQLWGWMRIHRYSFMSNWQICCVNEYGQENYSQEILFQPELELAEDV